MRNRRRQGGVDKVIKNDDLVDNDIQVIDDLPAIVPVSDAEIRVLELHLGKLLDEFLDQLQRVKP